MKDWIKLREKPIYKPLLSNNARRLAGRPPHRKPYRSEVDEVLEAMVYYWQEGEVL